MRRKKKKGKDVDFKSKILTNIDRCGIVLEILSNYMKVDLILTINEVSE